MLGSSSFVLDSKQAHLHAIRWKEDVNAQMNNLLQYRYQVSRLRMNKHWFRSLG